MNATPSTQCFNCQSARVVHGDITSERQRLQMYFRPRSLRFWTLNFSVGPALSASAFACQDCGFVWTEVSAEELTKFVRKHCDEPDLLPPAGPQPNSDT